MQCAPLNWIATYICKSCNLQFSHHLPLSLPPSHSVARGFEKRSLQRPELVNCHQCKIFWSGLHNFFILALSHSRWLISAHSGSFQVTLAHPGLPWNTLALSSSLWLTLAQSLALSGAHKVLAWPQFISPWFWLILMSPLLLSLGPWGVDFHQNWIGIDCLIEQAFL